VYCRWDWDLVINCITIQIIVILFSDIDVNTCAIIGVMEKVALRDFQLKASKYIDKLPIILTRYGKPIAIVISPIEAVK